MNIAIAQLSYHVGNFEANKRKMLDAIKEAKEGSADIICFAELVTTGYPPRDFLNMDDFIQSSDRVVDDLADAARGIAVVVGAPMLHMTDEGRKLYNAALFLHEGEKLHVSHKTFIPRDDIFDEFRYFSAGEAQTVFTYQGYTIALVIGEDIINIEGNIKGNTELDSENPLENIFEKNPDFILCPAVSPFDASRAEKRIKSLQIATERRRIPIFYVNHVGAQAGIIFDGGSLVVNQEGVVCDEIPYFEETVNFYDLADVKRQSLSRVQEKMASALIQDALIVGIQEYFDKLGFSKAILGLSGGLDSAVTAVLAAKALGISNVMAVMMPSRFSSDHSIQDSKELIDNLGIKSKTIPIHKIYNVFINELQEHFHQAPFDVTEENLQARIRGTILMALSNKLGYLLLNTTNKSEMAVGYGTLYGDLTGSMAVLGDVYKTEVYALARHFNSEEKLIPENILMKPPSAELRPDQKDSDSLPDYDVLDRILHLFIEEELSFHKIVKQGFDENLVRRILRLVNMNEFKRHQTAPVLRVSTKAFGMGRRMPIVSKYL